MKQIIFFLILTVSLSLQAQVSSKTYEDPPEACYKGCTSWMQNLLSDYENKGQLLKLEPAVYSGECRHLGPYDPDQTHYAVVMIDQHPTEKHFYFSTIFSYFETENEFRSWSLQDARNNMSEYWLDHGNLIQGSKGTRVEIEDDNGGLPYVYWMRQSPDGKELYYITYAGGDFQRSFCRLVKNQN